MSETRLVGDAPAYKVLVDWWAPIAARMRERVAHISDAARVDEDLLPYLAHERLGEGNPLYPELLPLAYRRRVVANSGRYLRWRGSTHALQQLATDLGITIIPHVTLDAVTGEITTARVFVSTTTIAGVEAREYLEHAIKWLLPDTLAAIVSIITVAHAETTVYTSATPRTQVWTILDARS